MKSEQKRIKHWLRLEQKKNCRDDSSIPPLDFWNADSLPRNIARMLSLSMLANKKKK